MKRLLLMLLASLAASQPHHAAMIAAEGKPIKAVFADQPPLLQFRVNLVT